MSYDPNRESKTEFFSAWNSADQTLPNKSTGSSQNFNLTLNLNTKGEGDFNLSSNVITFIENGLYAYFTGDVRSNSVSSSISGDLYEIHFNINDGDFSSGGQIQRLNRQDDQCYALASSGNLKLGYALRLSGNTLAPWVRVLGVLIEE